MSIAKNITIKHKLMMIIMATSFVALILVGISFIFWSQILAKNTLKQNLSTQAAMIAKNCEAAIMFGDTERAKDTLASLDVASSIIYGAIYNAENKIFALYSNHQDKMPPELRSYQSNEEYIYGNNTLIAAHPIKLNNEIIGTAVLCSDLSPVNKMLMQNVKIILSLLAIAFLLTYLISSKIQSTISVPILSLAKIASIVSQKQDYSIRASKNSNDEIGFLIDSFNYMLEHIQEEITDRKRAEEEVVTLNETLEQRVIMRTAELEKTHEQLMVASRHAGMAEVATDVLHNVGNVLNSINVQTTLLEDKVKESKVGNIRKAANMINSNIENIDHYLKQDDHGKHIPKYLCDVSQYMADNQNYMLEKLDALTNNVNHVKEIISMQQSYAKSAGVSIITTVEELVEEAIQINQAALMRHGIELKHEHEYFGRVRMDKQRIVQILVNLISNAKYAVAKNSSDNKTILVRSYSKNDRCLIEIIDNGIGISQENLTDIFRHGFTTKENGHGFGLHSSALSAKEMGGSLKAKSDGVGKGACFRLEIPLKTVEIKK